MKLFVKRIPVEFVQQYWNKVAPYIETVIPHVGGDYTLDQIRLYVSTGQWLLLVACNEKDEIRGASTIVFNNMPNDRVAFITTIAGRMISNEDTFNQFCTALRSLGATKIQGAMRESMARFSKQYGFKERHIILEKAL